MSSTDRPSSPNLKDNVITNAPTDPADTKFTSGIPIRSASGGSVQGTPSQSLTTQVLPQHKPESTLPIYVDIPSKIQRLVERNMRYPKERSLKELGIDFHPESLDFATGLTFPPTTQYYKPTAVERIKEYLNLTKGLKSRDDPYDSIWTEDDPMMRDNPQGEARGFCDMMKAHLKADLTGANRMILGDMVTWQSSLMYDTELLTFCTEQVSDWELAAVFPYNIRKENGKMHPFRRDPKLPHIITLLATEARPLERLSAGEVAAVVCLAEDFCTKSPYEAHDMYADIDAFPITMISGSDRSFRIVQACYYRSTQRISVFTSRTVNFDNGIRTNLDEYLQLLGWIIAEPI